ncbi:MAG: hypothetical protein H6707_09145 [Deltaproteobacteria bacterium]|nr:hypothetical protein [Deltaproteobacteria bacterium]
MQSCIDRVNCNDVENLSDRSRCIKRVEDAKKALNDLRGAPCTLVIRDTADQINNAPIDPATFCAY